VAIVATKKNSAYYQTELSKKTILA